jgi:hypothetical protein
MATITSNDDFVNAISYLISVNHLSVQVQGERFINPAARQLWDERGAANGGIVDITPDAATLEAALDNANIALISRQGQVESESELATAFAYIRQHIPALKNIQLKLLYYIQTYGNDPDAFGVTQLNGVYADLKQEFAASTYWRNRLKLFVKRRAIGQGISLANVNALFVRINDGTETTQDKALIWDCAETLIAQATTSAILARLIQ